VSLISTSFWLIATTLAALAVATFMASLHLAVDNGH
jgi:hypothetical protein